MSTAASLSILDNIVHDLRHSASAQPQSLANRSSVRARIRLPDPPSLYPSLTAIGAGERIAKEADRAYNTRALELRSHYEDSISNTFATLTNFPSPHGSEKRILDTFKSLYLKKVKSWIEDSVAAYKNSRKSAKQATNKDEVCKQTNPRQAFKTDYVPFLEHFFDKNPFPTHADKAFIARKSGMTYRQIHVWFQNRRNRTKKLNGTSRKKPACEGPLDILCEGMGKYTVRKEQSSYPPPEVSHPSHSNDRRLMRAKRSSETVSYRMTPPTDDNNVLDKCTTPLHAFPSPYPPLCAYQPFSLDSCNQNFSAFQWMRRPNRNVSSRLPKTDINDLVERFTLLSVRDIHPKRSQRNRGGMQDSLSATYSVTIRPPPAPHPALVKSMRVVSFIARQSPFPIVRASQSTSQVFIKPAPSSIHIPPPIHPGHDISSRWEVSPLPKWCPRQSFTPCEVTPTPSDVSSSTPSPCSSLRSLSDSSDIGKQALPPVPCSGSLIPHSSPPQLQACLATQELHSRP